MNYKNLQKISEKKTLLRYLYKIRLNKILATKNKTKQTTKNKTKQNKTIRNKYFKNYSKFYV
jgi:hypothetical protein